MELKEKQVLVVGAGVSGLSAAALLADEGAAVILYDENTALEPSELREKIGQRMKTGDFTGRVCCGELPAEAQVGTELLVLSPGVPLDHALVLEIRARGVPVIGEMELAYRFAHGKLAAVTGTNGKTTTTALLGAIMRTQFSDVIVAGNIGTPYTELVRGTTEETVSVIEMSSFQLETIEEFRPEVSAILNLTPDHMNRHHTMENYAAIKANIAKNQRAQDVCVLNYEDEWLRKLGKTLSCRVVWFSSARSLKEGLFLDGDCIVLHEGETDTIVCNVRELKLIGKHNYENVMAAVAAGLALSVPLASIHKALVAFEAVEHRIEYVANKRGVRYYNDSKGTNPDASIQAIRAMQTRTLLIAGGYDKGSEYDEWIDAFDGKIRYLILMGQTRDKIAEAARRKGFVHIILVDSMEEAVEFCKDNACEGESVLLSPCCASWGMFKNYEERGQIFKRLVNAIEECAN